MYRSNILLLVFSLSVVYCKPCAKPCESQCCADDLAVKKLQEYIRIDSRSADNLKYSVEFWERQASELGLQFAVYYPAGLPICVLKWPGKNPLLPSILLNSHVDVVPVEEAIWTYPPFSAHIDENCDIYGRGTQDTKSVGIQYIEAIKKLIHSNVTLLRNVYVTVMPDEETGGFHGMKPFIKTEEFKSMNVGFALDEGLTSPENTIYVTYQDRRPWQMNFTLVGKDGHGAQLLTGSAIEKLQKLINVIMNYRKDQSQIQKQKDPLDFGSYTSVNINVIRGGTAANVIPTEMYAIVDMRLAVDVKVADMDALVESWRRAAGNDTTIEYIRRDEVSAASPLDSNPYWQAMVDTARDIDVKMKPLICPATSDMVVVRNYGIPALGFAPRIRTQNRIHAVDEYLPVNVFLEGIDIYVAMLKSLANVPDFKTTPNKDSPLEYSKANAFL